MPNLKRRPLRLSFTETITFLERLGFEKPEDELLSALREGSIEAEGLVQQSRANSVRKPNPATRTIPRIWWYHIDASPKEDVVYFKETITEPPTPYRAEQISFLESDLKKHWSRSNKQGRPPGYDWEDIKAEVFRLMDHHGNFDPSDPKWNAQARLEEQIKLYCSSKFQREPATSTLRDKLKIWLTEWLGGKLAP